MLRATDDVPMSEEKRQRMLRKINGEEPLFPEHSAPTGTQASELTEHERELAALHRGLNKPLPPDLAAKIKAMEERASKKPERGEEGTRG